MVGLGSGGNRGSTIGFSALGYAGRGIPGIHVAFPCRRPNWHETSPFPGHYRPAYAVQNGEHIGAVSSRQPRDIVFLSAAATSAAIRAGDFTATDAVNAYLARIDAIDGDIKAYITVTREEALGAAADIDDALRRGDDDLINAPLFGAPVAIKDQFNTAGILTSNGSRAYAENVPSDDATVVTRLKAAGAILMGKLNLSELAMGGTADPPYGTPHNPWRFGHTPASPAAAPARPWPPTSAPRPSARTPAAVDAAPPPTATPSASVPPSPASAATASPPCAGSWTPRLP